MFWRFAGLRLARLVFLTLLIPASWLQAGPTAPEIPAPLQSWVDWSLYDVPDRECPYHFARFEQRRCAWPGKLELEADQGGLSFRQSWTLFRKDKVPLPGSDGYWPTSVTAHDSPVMVLEQDKSAWVELDTGEHQLSGHIPWASVPDSIKIPATTALYSLSVHGKSQAHPRLDADGRLWLVQRQAVAVPTADTEDKLTLRVYRHLADDLPFRIETHIEMEVSGQPREMLLGKILFDGYQPRSFDSPLPARIEPSGRLRVQLRPGQWQLDLVAHQLEPVDKVFLEHSDEGFWPEEEIWVFQSLPELRQVQIDGVDGVDPNQTTLPEPWKQWPAYRLLAGQAMQIQVLRRGDPQPSPNQLQNQRDLWLDFDGTGMTMRDRLQGNMHRDWRLSAAKGVSLGRLTLNGTPQVITELEGQPGVEIRQGQLNAEALSRFELKPDTHKQRFLSSGWQHDFDQLQGSLHLPPGWRAMLVTGVDSTGNTWMASWSVWDIFVVLIAVAAIVRLRGVWAGTVGGVSLLLIYPEASAFLYLLLNVIVVVTLTSLLPAGRFQRFVRSYGVVSVLALVLWLMGFMVDQARLAAFPQLAMPELEMGYEPPQIMATADDSLSSQGMAEAELAKVSAAPKRMMAEAYDSIRHQPPGTPNSGKSLQQLDPSLAVQTGPGVPLWHWQRVPLVWSGPVTADEQVTLWLLSPLENRILCGLRVLFGLLLLVAVLGLRRNDGQWQWTGWSGRSAVAAVSAVVVGLLTFQVPQTAQADIPDEKTLKTLQERVLKEQNCTPACLSVTKTDISLQQQRLTLRFTLNVLKPVYWSLPTSPGQWQADTVLLNEEAHPLFRQSPAASVSETFLPAGVQQLVISGPVEPDQPLQLTFPLKPHNINLSVDGFTVKGLDEGRLTASSLYFYPQQTRQTEDKPVLKPQNIAPFVHVERVLKLGLNWYLETRVKRIAPQQGGISLEIPLLEGESVTSRDVDVEKGMARISLAPGVNRVVWHSSLEKTSLLTLKAADTALWSEQWQVIPTALWHLEFEGLPMVKESHSVSEWQPRWRPYPGESLTLNITRPQAVKGQTKTIHWVRQTWNPGRRESATSLEMNISNSKGTEQRITLPAGVTVKEVKLNQELRAVDETNSNLIIPLNPGEHHLQVEWREPRPLEWFSRTPAVNVEDRWVNAATAVEVPRDRWVLMMGGPAMGPAILFWGTLVVALIVGYVLGRIPQLPLKSWHWMLLMLGLCSGWIEAIVPVVIWFGLMSMRGSKAVDTLSRWRFNLMQIFLATFTLFTFFILLAAIPNGLVGQPDMGVLGNGSSQYFLKWFVDRGEGELATAWVVSLPLWVYRALMLVWSLWLAVFLLRWLKWGWNAFVHEGYWRSAEKKTAEKPAHEG